MKAVRVVAAFGMLVATTYAAPPAHAAPAGPVETACDAIPPMEDSGGWGTVEFCDDPVAWVGLFVERYCRADCQEDLQRVYCRVNERLGSPCE